MIMNKLCITYNDISTYRSELMGWAIVWIMMLHFTFTQITPLGFVAQYGFAGVDIFMLVSGFGLFFSLDKNPRLGEYYRRRLLRIFPTYYIIGIFASVIVFHDSILALLFRHSTIGFWTGGPYWEWYIPSIVAFYLIAPLLKTLIDKGTAIAIALLAIIVLGLSYWIVANEVVGAKDPHFFMLYRFPAFLFGMMCAYWMKNKASMKPYYILLLIGIPCFILLFPHHHEIYNYKYLSLLFLLPVFTYSFILISKYMPIMNTVISQIGKASLEVYLFQNIFFNLIIDGRLTISPQWHDSFTLLLIILSSLLGILSHVLIEKGRKRLFA